MNQKSLFGKWSKVLLLAIAALFVSCTDDLSSDVNELSDRLDALEVGQIADLQDQVDSLEAALASAQSLINSNQTELQALIDALEAEIDALETELATKASQVDLDALEADVADLEKEVEALETELATVKAAAEAAQTAADTAQAAADAAQATANSAVTDAAAAQAAADAAQADADAAQAAADLAQADVDALELYIASLEAEIAATYATIATVELLEIRIATLESDVEDINTAIAALETKDEELDALIAANTTLINATADELKEFIDANSTAIDDLEEALTDLAAELASEIARIEGVISDIEARVTANEESIEDLEEALEDLEDVVEAIREDLQGQIDDLAALVAENTTNIEANDADIAAIQERLDDAEARLDGIDAELIEVWADLDAVREEFAAADDILYEKITAEYTAALAALRTSLEAWVGDQLSVYWSEYFDLTNDVECAAFVAAMKALLTDAAQNDWFVNQDELDAVSEALTTLREEFDTLSEDFGTLNAAYKQYVLDNDAAITAIKERLDSAEERLDLLESTVDDIYAKLVQLGLIDENGELVDLIGQNADAIEELEKDIETLEGDIKDLQDQIDDLDDTYATDEELEAAILKLEGEIQEKLDLIDDALEQIDTRLDGINNAITQIISELNSLKDTDDSLQEQIDVLVSDLEDLETTLQKQINALKDQIETINETLEDLQSQITALGIRVSVLEADMAQLLNQIQSISYVPTSVSGMEYTSLYKLVYNETTVDSATVEEYIMLSSDNSYSVSYDVRPTEAAEAVVAAFNSGDTTDKFYMQFENLTRAALSMEVTDIELVEGKDGRISVTFSTEYDSEKVQTTAIAFGMVIDRTIDLGDDEDGYAIYTNIMSDYATLLTEDKRDSVETIYLDVTLADEKQTIDFDSTESVTLFSDWAVSYTYKGESYTAAALEEIIGVDLTEIDESLSLDLYNWSWGSDYDPVLYFNYSGSKVDDANLTVAEGEDDVYTASLITPGLAGYAGYYARAFAITTFTYGTDADGEAVKYTAAEAKSTVTINPETLKYTATTSTVWNSNTAYWNSSAAGGSGAYRITLDLVGLAAAEGTSYGEYSILEGDWLRTEGSYQTTVLTLTCSEDDEDAIQYAWAVNATFGEDIETQQIMIQLNAEQFAAIFGDGSGAANEVNYTLTADYIDGTTLLRQYTIDVTSTFEAYPSIKTSAVKETVFTYSFDNANSYIYTDTFNTSFITNTYGKYFEVYEDGTGTGLGEVVTKDDSDNSDYTVTKDTIVTDSNDKTYVTSAKTNIYVGADGDIYYEIDVLHEKVLNTAQEFYFTHTTTIESRNMPYTLTLVGKATATFDFSNYFTKVALNPEYFIKEDGAFTNKIELMGSYYNNGKQLKDSEIIAGSVVAQGFGFRAITLDEIFIPYYTDATGTETAYASYSDFDWTYAYSTDVDYDNSFLNENEFTFISPATETAIAVTGLSYNGIIIDDAFASVADVLTETEDGYEFTALIPDDQRPISYETNVFSDGITAVVNYGEGAEFNVTTLIDLYDRLGTDIFAAEGTGIWNSSDWYSNMFSVYTSNSRVGTFTPSVAVIGDVRVTDYNDASGVDIQYSTYSDYMTISDAGVITLKDTSKNLQVNYSFTFDLEVYNPWYYEVIPCTVILHGNGISAPEVTVE